MNPKEFRQVFDVYSILRPFNITVFERRKFHETHCFFAFVRPVGIDGADYTTSTTTVDKAGSGHYGFQLSATEGHTPGSYTADVYLDGVLTKTVSFTVAASGPPSLGDVVVTKGLEADNKPTETTSTFSPKDIVYVSVRVNNLVVGSKVKVIYTLNGQSNETVSTADKPGSGYYGFSLSPAADGHPTGDYTADVYLDDVLITTVTFTVQ